VPTAYSRVKTAPSPALSGTSVTVQDNEGARFEVEPTPFTALVWTRGQVPVLGTNAERATVTDVVGDVLTLERGSPAVAIASGMQVASLSGVPASDLGTTVVLAGDFPTNEPPYVLHYRDPGGSVHRKDSSSGVTDDGAGAASFSLLADRGGVWSHRWESALRVLTDQDFFVRFSETL
jgi:hypothetical protein